MTPIKKNACDVGLHAAAPSAPVDEEAACAALALFPRADLSDDELEQPIGDLAWAWRTAYDRFEQHGLPTDRDEALMLLHLHNQAMLSRSPAAQATRWAGIQQAIDDDVGYFAYRGEQDRLRMERGC